MTEYRVTEEAYDTNLNPIRAKVSLGMRVLTYDDLDLTNPGYALFLVPPGSQGDDGSPLEAQAAQQYQQALNWVE